MPTELVTLNNLTSRSNMEEARKNKLQNDPQNVALLKKKVQKMNINEKNSTAEANGGRNKKRWNSKNKVTDECKNCKLKSHYKKDCWFLEENKDKRTAS